MATTVPDGEKPSFLDYYFKPDSLTWWSAVIPLVAGVVLWLAGTFPSDMSAEIVTFIQSIWPQATAGVLINIGLAGIGIRGAIGDTASEPVAAPPKEDK